MKKKRDRTQEQLDRLRQVRTDAADPAPILRDALASPSNYVASKAAALVEELQVTALIPDLLTAFDRFMADAPALDKGCSATEAIIKALYALDYQEPGPYLRGIRHRQPEGFGQGDVATGLRGACALGLSQTRDERALDELVLLLTASEAPARLSAARAIGCRNEPSCIPLLQLKVHIGDPELEVLAECMAGMLAIACNQRTLNLVSEELDSTDRDRAEAAAIALSSVRDDRAFEALRSKWESTGPGPLGERLLRAIAMSRTEKAIEFLTGLVAGQPLRIATMAVNALSIQRRDSRIAAMAAELASQRPEVANAIRAAFNRSTLE